MKNTLVIITILLLYSIDHSRYLTPASTALANNSPILTDGFDFPVGKPDAKGYYNAQKFGNRNIKFGSMFHLGEDWNGVRGGNTDLGDPVYTIANGVVSFTGDAGPGWGNVVRVIHHLPADHKLYHKYKKLESFYAHLKTMSVKKGECVKRGQKIGEIGSAHGAYYAHLHFELRNIINMPLAGGYAKSINGYLDPTGFIRANRPAPE